ncbi:MAG: PHP domain-containing protein [Chloroflexota bacterium]|nr:PHP domain-containing protein [Chloroflexota bacterium]
MLKADLHVHTCYSKDSTSPIEEIIQHCLEIGIDCLAITDHDTISGALEMKRTAPFTVIVGEEVLTTCGEIIGLFLSEQVPSYLSPEETVVRIKSQGGLVCIPHPFDRFRPHSRLRNHALQDIMNDIDLVEVFNSRTIMQKDSKRALRLAQELGVPGTTGSDAHIVTEVGRSFVELPEFDNAEQFQQSLRNGKIFRSKTSTAIHLYNIKNRVTKLFHRS